MNSAVINELKRIADEHDGYLRPGDVVEAAREESSPLHSRFEWDDSAAAVRYRLWQARQLISITIEYIGPKEEEKEIRVFVSLTPDRKGGGGYRTVESVMRDADARKQLLADAMDDMERFEKKYADLKELADVFAAMKQVKAKKGVAA